MNKRYYTSEIIKSYITSCGEPPESESYPWIAGFAKGMVSVLLNATDPQKEIARYIEEIERHLEETGNA